MNHYHSKRLLIAVFLTLAPCKAKQAVDYNGNPISTANSIIITPRTSPIALANYTQALNTAGLLDNTFGNGGIVAGTIVGGSPVINAIALQSDGKIVVAGTTNIGGGGTFITVRYNSNGTIDSSFNNGSPILGPNGGAYAIAVQPNGAIIVAGTTNVAAGGGGHFCITRYTAGGAIDTTFNGGTPVATGITGGAFALALQPNGALLVGGTNNIANATAGAGHDGVSNFVLTRYTSTGTIDPTFNGGVIVTGASTQLNGPAAIIYALLLQPNGNIVTIGATKLHIPAASDPIFCLSRYTTTGAIDNSFNNGNPVITGATNVAYAGLLQSDGKIVAVGSNLVGGGNFEFALVRYNSDGSVDQTFNNGNTINTPNTSTAYSALLQPDGKIIAVGKTTTGGGGFCLVHYNIDGSLDTTFGPNGTNIISTAGTATAYAALLLPNNEIVAVGQNATPNFSLARYINPFTLASFSASYGNVGLL